MLYDVICSRTSYILLYVTVLLYFVTYMNITYYIILYSLSKFKINKSENKNSNKVKGKNRKEK